jgi:hypothetical protein
VEAKADRLRHHPAVNPFIDPQGYRAFVAEAEQAFRERLAAER